MKANNRLKTRWCFAHFSRGSRAGSTSSWILWVARRSREQPERFHDSRFRLGRGQPVRCLWSSRDTGNQSVMHCPFQSSFSLSLLFPQFFPLSVVCAQISNLQRKSYVLQPPYSVLLTRLAVPLLGVRQTDESGGLGRNSECWVVPGRACSNATWKGRSFSKEGDIGLQSNVAFSGTLGDI